MVFALLDLYSSVEHLSALLAKAGKVFAAFDAQDSGCWSAGVEADDGQRWFVKLAGTSAGESAMRRVQELHRQVRHPSIIPVVHSFACADGLVNIYPWADGDVLYHPTTDARPDRTLATHPMACFRSLPLPRVETALDTVLDAHQAICAAGWVAVDFYDGCLLYDFGTHVMRLIDLDEYRPGPFTVPGDRLPGSSRYLAPEERRHGALVDERTTVHALGRMLRLLMDGGDMEADWRGTPAQLAVVTRATDPDPSRRQPTVSALRETWHGAGRA
ncbi:serine/threonine protein kinase [Streptacidiphilus jiangxiensis]|nr:serine/threonine protein kinase [Streptacidiphilus jiangxiensis]